MPGEPAVGGKSCIVNLASRVLSVCGTALRRWDDARARGGAWRRYGLRSNSGVVKHHESTFCGCSWTVLVDLS